MSNTTSTTAAQQHTRPAPVSQRFFHWWAALLLLTSLAVGSLMVFTFGAVSFAAIFALWLREGRARPRRKLDKIAGIILALSTVWFLFNIAIELIIIVSKRQSAGMYAPLLMLALFYPPLIMHQFYLEKEPSLKRNRGWMIPIRITYALSSALVIAAFLILFPAIFLPGMVLVLALQVALFALFAVAMIYSAILFSKSRSNLLSRERRLHDAWNMILLALTLGLFFSTVGVLVVRSDLAQSHQSFLNYLGILSRSLPLCFFFVGTYYHDRFAFFDVFIKRGTYFFLLLLSLLAYFAFVDPLLDRSEVGRLKPWILALTLSPLLLLLPWAYSRMALWMDRFWLGRRFSTVQAVKYFLGGTQDAIDESALVQQAEKKLSAIFIADVNITLSTGGYDVAGTFESVHEVPIRERGGTVGWIRMGRRHSDTPYFSEDLSLLGSLADVFSSVLENVRLQQRKREQERNEQELRLTASRSELKALRAQINPHFLFNALNAIAGLIHKEPSRAEETVEELAEVFRYTLKRSEKELVRLEEELDFVRAYLDVEKARFGDRLSIQLDVHEDVKGEMIPTMAIQTLVENAVKHGVAAIRGAGIVEIRARRKDDQLWLEVLDNGPGPSSARPTDEPARDGSGYGLRNLASRLKAHYGSLGSVTIRRDPANRITVASIRLPLPVSRPA
jgi:anti-sigma regulatory factor (Ser/Thr protein kinase)/GAF domain-containing protein